MPNYAHPGIYVQEVPSTRSIQGASTSVAAFVGITEKGPVNQPTLITSWNAFQRLFGGFIWFGFTPWAVYEFFLEGGTACYVVRTDTGSGKAATTSLGSTTVTAASPGVWGNTILVNIANSVPTSGNANTPSPIFSLQVAVDAATIDAVTDLTKVDLPTQLMVSFVRQNGLAATTVAGKSCYVLESFSGCTDTGPGFVTRINSNSMFIRVASSDGKRPDNTSAPKALTGGVAASNQLSLSVNTLSTVQSLSLLAVPDSVTLTDSSNKSNQAAQGTLINLDLQFCEGLTSLFYAVDPPFGLDVSGITSFKSGAGATTGGNGTALNSSYGALYYPWLWIFNPIAALNVPVPPSGPVLGRYAYTDANVGVYKSPAGVNDGALRSVVAVNLALTDSDQDMLNPNGINAVRNQINYGNVIWGARTLSQDSQWIYVSIRRLFIYVEQSLKNSLQWVVFERNDQPLWSSVTRDITAFLTTLWQQGGLFGASAAEAFFVTCDASNNPPETRQLGQLYIDIGLAPVYPAEFVIIRITQKTAGPDSGS